MQSQVSLTLRFTPPTTKRYKDAPYDLQLLVIEDKISDFQIFNEALSQAISIANLEHFNMLERLTLRGNRAGF